MDTRILRENDIRGKYPTSIDEVTCLKIGKAFGTYIRKNKCNECVVGHDNRLSGKSLTNALIEGLKSTGVNIIYLNTVTTPMLNYACIYLNKVFGVEVTASHNPKDENGIKMFQNFLHITGENLKEIYNLILTENFIEEKQKGIVELFTINELYKNMLVDYTVLENKNLKVVIDPGNGTSSLIAKSVFDSLGIKTLYINDISDGNFPNHHPDPNVAKNLSQLQEMVLRNNADVGLAFDGDCDRFGVVDNEGNIIETDKMIALFAENIMKTSTNTKFLVDVKCSRLTSDIIKKYGGTPIIVKNGSAYIETELNKRNIVFGGEYSGHVFFRDRFFGFDDGIYAGLRLLEILSKKEKSCSELFASYPKYYNTEEIRVATKDEIKFEIIEKIKKYAIEKKYEFNDIDGIKIEFPDSWALIRCSNTGPNLTMRFEATNKEELSKIQKEFTDLVNKLNM